MTDKYLNYQAIHALQCYRQMQSVIQAYAKSQQQSLEFRKIIKCNFANLQSSVGERTSPRMVE